MNELENYKFYEFYFVDYKGEVANCLFRALDEEHATQQFREIFQNARILEVVLFQG